jgi:hypothetical protein
MLLYEIASCSLRSRDANLLYRAKKPKPIRSRSRSAHEDKLSCLAATFGPQPLTFARFHPQLSRANKLVAPQLTCWVNPPTTSSHCPVQSIFMPSRRPPIARFSRSKCRCLEASGLSRFNKSNPIPPFAPSHICHGGRAVLALK